MDVEDLATFNFEQPIQRNNILTEKKINVIAKGNERSVSIFSPKVDKSLENKLIFDRQNENKISSKDLT
jgi:hypothetical protein